MRGKALQALLLAQKLGRGIAKYKLVVILLVFVLVGVIGWQAHRVSVNNDWKKATDYYRRADYDNAAKILKDMSMPSDSDRLAIYAQTMLATRDLDKAAKAYNKLYDNKKDPNSKLMLGNIYNQQKKYDEAAKIYNDLIASNPSYTQVYVNLATLYKMQGKNDEATKVAVKAVKNNPNSTVLNELLVSMTMQDKNSQEYKDAVSRLRQLNPNDPLLESLNQ